MSKDKGKSGGRVTESDIYKSYTHERPDPSSSPPTERPKPSSSSGSSSDSKPKK